jgi:error-prone DNA polymerase
LGLEALALTDHNGFYGVVRFAEAARAVGLPTVFGAELTLGSSGLEARSHGDPPTPTASTWSCWPATPRGTPGWPGPSALRPDGRREERPAHHVSRSWRVDLRGTSGGSGNIGRGDHLVLTGCRKGTVPPRWSPTVRRRPNVSSGDSSGRHGSAGRTWPSSCGITVIRSTVPATTPWSNSPCGRRRGRGHQQRALRHPRQRRLATALAAVRARRSLDELDGWIPGRGSAHLRSGAEQARRFARYPGVVEAAAAWGGVRVRPALVAPNLPPYPCPAGTRVSRSPRWQFLRPSTGRTRPARPRRYGSARFHEGGVRGHARRPLRADRPRARSDRVGSGSPATS